MPQDEGVIKYNLVFDMGDAPRSADIEDINNWRTLLHQMQLIGQDVNRYGGLGFGNISCRRPGNPNHFIVSGTQTGGIHLLKAEHYCTITQCDIHHNKVKAFGLIRPSSEAVSHGVLYQLSADINVVIHVHCPEIWQCADSLRLPKTGPQTPYGTAELANEISRLYAAGAFAKQHIVVVPGHEDGVIAFGSTAEHAGHQIVKTLASAIQNFK